MAASVAAVLLALASVLVAAATAPAGAATAAEQQEWLARINDLRASRGLGPLALDTEQNGLAQERADVNAANGVLAHTPSLTAGVTENWLKLGENVGVGPDVATIFSAFVNSPRHYANLVDPAFTHIGIGVTIDGSGRMWVTHRFLQLATAGTGGGGTGGGGTSGGGGGGTTGGGTTGGGGTTRPPRAQSTMPAPGPGTGTASPPTTAAAPPPAPPAPAPQARAERVAAMLDALHALPR